MKNILRGAAAAAAVGAVALGFAAPAAAGPDEYIYDLEQAGFYGDTATALDWGYRICTDLNAGWSYDEIVANVWAGTDASIDGADAWFIVEAADLFLC